jgi:ABC-2 type transport system permease protein
MSGFGPIYLLITRRLLRRRRLVALGVVAALPGLLLLIVDVTHFNSAEAAYEQLTVQLYLAFVLPLIGLVLGSAALGDERRGRTLPYLALKPVPRWVIVSAATAAAATAVGTIGLVGWTVGWLVSLSTTGSPTAALPVLVAVTVAVTAYVAVFVPLGYVTRWAVLIGLAYVFVWEAILVTVIDALGASSIHRIGLSAYAAVADLGRDTLDLLGTVTPGLGGAAAKTVVVLVLSLALTTTLLRKRDIG